MREIRASDIESDANLSKEVRIAVSRFLNKHPDFATLLMRLCKLRSTNSPQIPTAGTDGATIWFNSSWMDGLSLDERVFIIGHEVLHVVYEHMSRALGYAKLTMGPDGKLFQHSRWNKAGDYYINKILHDAGVGKMPIGGLFDPNIDWQTQGVTEIYCMLPEDDPEDGEGGHGGNDVHVVPDHTTDPPTQQETQRAMAQAADIAEKTRGDSSDVFGKLFGKLMEPKKNWREILRSHIVNHVGQDEYSYARINKRQLVATNMISPGLVGFSSNAIAVIEDISSSVSQAERDAFRGELRGILEDARPAACKVFFVNTEIQEVKEIEDYAELEDMEAPVGGGTDMEAAYPGVYEAMLDAETEYSIVILTDGETYTDTSNDPGVPVIWVTTSATDFAYGEVVELDV